MCKKKILSLSAAVAVLSTGALAFDTNVKNDVIRLDGARGKYIARPNGYNINVGAANINNTRQSKADDNSIGDTTPTSNGDVTVNGVDVYYDYATLASTFTRNGQIAKQISPIIKKGPGAMGDVLIFPAFFGGLTEKEKNDPNNERSEWSSEFSVVNNSEYAVIAKVVLYGKIASEELRDFNIYLSAHDVFRATLKNGRLISTDGSTVAEQGETTKNPLFKNNPQGILEVDEDNYYKYNYDATMASSENELNVTIDPDEELDDYGKHIGGGHGIYGKTETDFEHEGYIVVYAMAQADQSYHQINGTGLHKELWKDYRHLVDTCRDSVTLENGKIHLHEWRVGIEEGIYTKNKLFLPSVDADVNATGREGMIVATKYQAEHLCNTVFASEAYSSRENNGEWKKRREVHFGSPGATLTGSILVSQDGSDGLGTRAMLLKAYALDNFTDDNANQMLLWTEGEFAHLADRCLYYDIENNASAQDGNGSKYYQACVETDAKQLDLHQTIYEYTETDPNLSKLIVTQPYKRVLVQFKAETDKKKPNYPTYEAYAWYEDTGFDVQDPRKYGQFTLGMDIYDDNEKSFTPTFGNFIVSPATAGFTKGIPYEVSNIDIFATMSKEDKEKFRNDYKKGYAIIRFDSAQGMLPGIVTQMSAHIIPTKSNPNNAEVNWIYPFTN
jgi:hypothetical protein